MIDFAYLTQKFLVQYISNTCKWQTFAVHTLHFLYKLAESYIMPGTNC